MSTDDLAAVLLEGPRGRRLCLSLAEDLDEELGALVFPLAHRLDTNPGTLLVFTSVEGGGPGEANEVDATGEPTVARVAERLRRIAAQHPSFTDQALVTALVAAVDTARYWQESDGQDVLAALPEVRDALGGIAALVAASAFAQGWSAPRTPEQWAIEWHDDSDSGAHHSPLPAVPAAEMLERWAAETHADEARAARERPRDPTASWSGEWWSHPWRALQTTGTLPGGVPVRLSLIEDGFGWTDAVAIPVRGAGHTYEIDHPEAWVELCRRYPLEVTASRRHDWYRVTGRDGGWVIPDWQRVAADWDAVHLTTLGYLATATRELPVSPGFSTVLGGWSPDVTVWLSDGARECEGARVAWHRERNEIEWVPVAEAPVGEAPAGDTPAPAGE